MPYLLSALVLALAGAFILAAAGALRSGHLLFLYVRSGDHVLLERGEDGRYQVLPAPHLPGAVARYAWAGTRAALGGTRERTARYFPSRAAHV